MIVVKVWQKPAWCHLVELHLLSAPIENQLVLRCPAAGPCRPKFTAHKQHPTRVGESLAGGTPAAKLTLNGEDGFIGYMSVDASQHFRWKGKRRLTRDGTDTAASERAPGFFCSHFIGAARDAVDSPLLCVVFWNRTLITGLPSEC